MIKSKNLCKALIACGLVLSSCGMPKDVVYFQDLTAEEVMQIENSKGLVAKPNDELAIIVNSPNPELSMIFNLPLFTTLAGRAASTSYNQQVSTYTVDLEGNINFPLIGEIYIEGLSRTEIAAKIKDLLIEKQLISDPVVSVNFVNIFYSVTGEVSKPGRFPMDRDRMTIVDALSSAGDLTIYGNRMDVKVIRRECGEQHTYVLDLTNAESLSQSPAYFIQQDDVIYVSPNTARARMSTVNGNNLTSYSFWLSIVSVLTSVAVLIFK